MYNFSNRICNKYNDTTINNKDTIIYSVPVQDNNDYPNNGNIADNTKLITLGEKSISCIDSSYRAIYHRYVLINTDEDKPKYEIATGNDDINNNEKLYNYEIDIDEDGHSIETKECANPLTKQIPRYGVYPILSGNYIYLTDVYDYTNTEKEVSDKSLTDIEANLEISYVDKITD